MGRKESNQTKTNNTVDPDQLASVEASWYGSTLHSILIENTRLQLESDYRLKG